MSAHFEPQPPWNGRSDTEDGAAARRVHHCIGSTGDLALLGFACDAGVRRNQGRAGAADAPQAIRAALGNLAAPANLDAIADLGNVVVADNALEAGQEMLADTVSSALANHRRIVVLGGGHETAFASYSGLYQSQRFSRIGIINLDAHLDLRNPSDRGPSSGTPFNQIRQLNPAHFDYLCIGVARESNTQALFERAQDWNVGVVFDTDLDATPDAATAAITEMTQRCDGLYLTIDMDVLPHHQAPGVSAPAVRGVPLRCIEQLLVTIDEACKAHQCKLPLADIVEVCPPHDRDGVTARLAAVLALRLLQLGEH